MIIGGQPAVIGGAVPLAADCQDRDEDAPGPDIPALRPLAGVHDNLVLVVLPT